MATIDYEKKYKDALEKARQLCAYPTTKPFISDLQDIFPELRESEDEMMVKFIKNQLFNIKKTITDNYKLDTELTKAIDWLEKQGEQPKKHDVCDYCDQQGSCVSPCSMKLVEKQGEQKSVVIIPKFRVGDEIKTSNEESLTITKIDEKGYWSEDLFICDFDEECLWDLVEQKPTEEYNITGIKSKHAQGKLGEMIKRKLEMEKQGEQILANSAKTCKDEQKPEVDQHSLPVSDDSSLPTFDESIYHPCTEKVYEQKPWSEEDESLCRQIEGILSVCRTKSLLSFDLYKKMLDLLKSLKDRVQPQPKQEWSEEDERHLNNIINRTVAFGDSSIHGLIKDDIDWLKSLRPQSQWKPSDEQMEALNDVISSRDIKYDVLSELWKDLKKLREK